MTRKLLPYEYQLIEALGISKDEYLDFIAAAPLYEDPKEGTVLDIRNAEATVALVLTIVGILFQVASALLTPRPEIPTTRGVGQSRDQRFAPRFGFNGAQELANYGDPLPLVYTNTSINSRGGVRVSTALLWSAVLSYGGNQFMRLMLSIGAGKIGAIDIYRSALGQLPLRDYTQSNLWAYFNDNSYTKYAQLATAVNTFQDPTRVGSASRPTARLTTLAGQQDKFGFSQAYAPTTSVSCGVTAVIPINVQVMVINPNGDRRRFNVDTQLTPNTTYWPTSGVRPNIPVGTQFTIKIQQTIRLTQAERDLFSTEGIGRYAKESAFTARRAEASALFEGARFKIGSAILRLISVDNTETDQGVVTATFTCERRGKFPAAPYASTHWIEDTEDEIAKQKSIIKQQENTIAILNKDKEDLQYYQDFLARVVISKYSNFNQFNPAVEKYRSLASSVNIGKKDVKVMLRYVEKSIKEAEETLAKAETRLDSLKDQGSLKSIQALYTKCMAHIEEAQYASTTKCHVVDFALKIRAYRRLSGRADVYGSEQEDYGDSASENGPQPRTVMFRMYWRFAGTTEYTSIPYIFCVRNSTEQDVFTYVKLVHANAAFTQPKAAQYWEVKFEPVLEPGAEPSITKYCYLQQTGKERRLPAGTSDVHVMFNGTVYDFTTYPPINKTAENLTEWDLFNYDSNSQSQFSYEQGPEVNITAVNEQLLEPWNNYSDRLYNGISTLGLHLFASKATESLRSVSVWVTQGKLLRPLSLNPADYDQDSEINALVNSTPSASSSYAPDIFLDTILDKENGIGQYADIHSVDVPQLAKTKRFCRTNKLYMDGIIADQRSWREFWAQTAPFSLLELAKIGGRDTLVPGVPYNETTGEINPNIQVSALFTAGNILEDSYKEEFLDYGASVQDTVVSAIYRDTENNDVFPRNASVQVHLKEVDPDAAVLETLDLSQYVTRREQAILLAKFLCLSKHYIRRAIEFKTFPTDSPVFPGAYIYVEIGLNQWNSIYSGRVEGGGFLNAPLPRQVPDGQYTVFLYRQGNGTFACTNVQVANGYAPQIKSYEGALFVLGNAILNKRVFRVTEVIMDEEGETTIKAVEHQTDSSGRSQIAKRLTSANEFYVDGVLS